MLNEKKTLIGLLFSQLIGEMSSRGSVRIPSRLAAVYLSELKVWSLKGWYSELSGSVQSNPQESVNLQLIKNRIHNMIFNLYSQDPGNLTSWSLREMNFQFFFQNLAPWTLLGDLQRPSKFQAVR